MKRRLAALVGAVLLPALPAAQAHPTYHYSVGCNFVTVTGVVDVTPEGDVYVAGEWFWDCPPYGS